MKIIPKETITFDFFVEVDSDGNKLSYKLLRGFFYDYPDMSILEYIAKKNGSLELDRECALDNQRLFDYLVGINILTSTNVSNFFLVNDTDRLKTFIIKLHKVYLDIRDNYDMYKRDFEINKVLSCE